MKILALLLAEFSFVTKICPNLLTSFSTQGSSKKKKSFPIIHNVQSLKGEGGGKTKKLKLYR